MANVIVKEPADKGQSLLITDNPLINLMNTTHAVLASVVF